MWMSVVSKRSETARLRTNSGSKGETEMKDGLAEHLKYKVERLEVLDRLRRRKPISQLED